MARANLRFVGVPADDYLLCASAIRGGIAFLVLLGLRETLDQLGIVASVHQHFINGGDVGFQAIGRKLEANSRRCCAAYLPHEVHRVLASPLPDHEAENDLHVPLNRYPGVAIATLAILGFLIPLVLLFAPDKSPDLIGLNIGSRNVSDNAVH